MSKCKYCNKDFVKNNGKQMYCCRYCKDKAKRERYKKEKPKIEKTCKNCKQKFFAIQDKQRFCSERCTSLYTQNKEHEKICRFCGKKFLGKLQSVYCSEACKSGYYKENPRYEKKCDWCNKTYGTNKLSTRFCGTECQYEWQRDSEEYKKVQREIQRIGYNNLEERTKMFVERLNARLPQFEYHSGYEHSEKSFKMKCKKCGYVQERIASIIRGEAYKAITCDGCMDIDREVRREVRERELSKKRLTRTAQRIINKQSVQRKVDIEIQLLFEEEIKKEKMIALKNQECEECGELFNATAFTQKYCSNKCGNRRNDRVKRLRRDKRLRENGVIDWDISLEKLISRDDNICHICNKECDYDDYIITEEGHHIAGNNYPSIDHVVPVVRGGTHTWGNVRVAHRICNSIKSDREAYEEGTGQMAMIV